MEVECVVCKNITYKCYCSKDCKKSHENPSIIIRIRIKTVCEECIKVRKSNGYSKKDDDHDDLITAFKTMNI